MCEQRAENTRERRNTKFEVSKSPERRRDTAPVKSQVRVLEPILSPSRPMKAPARKLTREHNACWSAVRNVVSPGVSHNLASARPSYERRDKKLGGSEIRRRSDAPGQSFRFGRRTKRRWQRMKRCPWIGKAWSAFTSTGFSLRNELRTCSRSRNTRWSWAIRPLRDRCLPRDNRVLRTDRSVRGA